MHDSCYYGSLRTLWLGHFLFHLERSSYDRLFCATTSFWSVSAVDVLVSIWAWMIIEEVGNILARLLEWWDYSCELYCTHQPSISCCSDLFRLWISRMLWKDDASSCPYITDHNNRSLSITRQQIDYLDGRCAPKSAKVRRRVRSTLLLVLLHLHRFSTVGVLLVKLRPAELWW